MSSLSIKVNQMIALTKFHCETTLSLKRGMKSGLEELNLSKVVVFS